jgi:DNA invertase Pin-like site-specific DNA recombinase
LETAMATYAYLRVSTDRQDIANQRHGILEYANTHGLAPVQFVEDAASGRLAWRDRALGRLLCDSAVGGDVVIFAEISRVTTPPAKAGGFFRTKHGTLTAASCTTLETTTST